jgi:hypothetical protein
MIEQWAMLKATLTIISSNRAQFQISHEIHVARTNLLDVTAVEVILSLAVIDAGTLDVLIPEHELACE